MSYDPKKVFVKTENDAYIIETLVKLINSLECTADDLFADLIEHGYKQKASRLSDEIEQLDKTEQKKIFDVVEVMVKNAQ